MPLMYMMTFHNPGPLNWCSFTLSHFFPMPSIIYLKETINLFFYNVN
jgi:hypothetical protein